MILFDQHENDILEKLSRDASASGRIDPGLYDVYGVKKGLRDINGVGVLAGLTQIGEVIGHDVSEGKRIPAPGRLIYRGYDVSEIVENYIRDDRFGFEETIYLLLFGRLPGCGELMAFNGLLDKFRALPDRFIKESILTSPCHDMMNSLARSVLALYSYDENADDISIDNVIRQSLQLIANLPMLTVYGYQAFLHYHCHDSLTIHNPKPGLGTAENILHMLRTDSSYTRAEARLLDLLLVLHAEHGGGNNSSFITHIATSTATDTYSVIAAALGSLKGRRQGGANVMAALMLDDLKDHVSDWANEKELARYLQAILDRKAFDGSGYIYGFGHAVYSISDPRAEMLRKYSKVLAEEKGFTDEFRLYETVAKLAPDVIRKSRKIYKGVCVNVDFYSGFVFKMLGIPRELFTPLFAVSRIVGWSAHRIEELVNDGKIIRPAYKSIASRHDYVGISDRA